MTTPGERLKYYRNQMGITQTALASMVGMVWHQIKDIESGRVKLSKLIAKLLYWETGVNPAWLFTGEGPMDLKAQVEMEKMAIRESEGHYGDARAEIDDYVFIPCVTGRISAGGGLVADNSIEMRVAFRRDWLQRRGDPQRMSVIRVQGDSMTPTLQSGDVVLVDHSRDHVDLSGGIYAVAVGDEIMIKRVQVLFADKRLRIISDNAKYEPLDVTADQVIINGRVIWYAREMER